MTTRESIAWFKSVFGPGLGRILADTRFSVDMLTAIAMQETGYIWSVLVEKNLSVPRVLELCVGDTIDKGRTAFPTSKADLRRAPNGERMFNIARQALVDMAQYIGGYSRVATNPDKFCHGYGIFQYDLQFFRNDPDYFLQKKWADFGACARKCISELDEASRRQGWAARTGLTDTEKVYVAIAYNRGRANPGLGFKQGYRSDDGRYYGENIFEYLRIAQAIGDSAHLPVVVPSPPAAAPLPQPTPVEATRDIYEVDVRETSLRLRTEPWIDKRDPRSNVVAHLPAGQLVHRIAGKKGDQFFEIETNLRGAYFHGFAAAAYLRPAKGENSVPVVVPATSPPSDGIVAVYMPRKAGKVTRRTEPAGPWSLNEPGQPTRDAETAAGRCAQLATIIDWLAVDRPAHQRYQPTGGGTTFCNIYAHDYCFLAGVYLPRVWWTPSAIEQLARNETVEPLYEQTIDEQRSNDLFRWLGDFGPRFGWRSTGTLTKLQEAANLGGVGIIIARRKIDGKSGHIVAVVPETDEYRAQRNSDCSVIGPVQSQAGVTNFRYRSTTNQWWKGDQFADSALWIHA
jgi:hypothetical protein